MNKKLFLPLVVFLAIIVAFMVQLSRNAQGEDPKALESVLVGKTIPDFSLDRPLHASIQ